MFDNIDPSSLLNLLTDIPVIYALLLILRRQRKNSDRLHERLAELRAAADRSPTETSLPQADRRSVRHARRWRARRSGFSTAE